MKLLKILAILVLVYVGIVVLFESLLGTFQPRPEGTMVITATDAEGEEHERVVTALEVNDELYVAANHWPRAWYRAARENPQVRVTRDGETRDYRAVRVRGEEYERVVEEHPRPLAFKFVTGFPSRPILRLEPR